MEEDRFKECGGLVDFIHAEVVGCAGFQVVGEGWDGPGEGGGIGVVFVWEVLIVYLTSAAEKTHV